MCRRLKRLVNWGKQISKIDYSQTKSFSTWPVCALDRWRFGSYGGKVSSLRHHQDSWKMFFIVILLNLDFLIFLVQFWLPPGYWWGDLEGFCFVGKVRTLGKLFDLTMKIARTNFDFSRKLQKMNKNTLNVYRDVGAHNSAIYDRNWKPKKPARYSTINRLW